MTYLYRLLIGLGLILAPLAMVVPSKPWGLACALTALATILAVAIMEALGIVAGWKEADEDEERRVRLMNEYAVPNFAVEEVRVIRTAEAQESAPRIEGPPSRYDRMYKHS
jgi:hypothetical protein